MESAKILYKVSTTVKEILAKRCSPQQPSSLLLLKNNLYIDII